MSRVTPDGIEFGPTASGKTYISLNYHRQPNRGKSCWLPAILPDHEYELFSTADEGDWSDEYGNLWSVGMSGYELGTRGERIAKNPLPANVSDAWHGYPASPAQKGAGDAPPDALLEAWQAAGLVSRTFARRVQKWRI